MNNQKGFDGWIPIFRGGKQKDSNGIEHDGDALIAKALANFNAAVHEPPAVIGHPKDNAPAYGWVEGLKKGVDKAGNLLLAKFKQVQPVFAQMVEQGSFKKRSAAFYPDGTLRHVGFLGAMPPAVKGLPDVAFAEGDAASFEFSDSFGWQTLANTFRRIRDYIIEKDGQDTADRLIPDWTIEDLKAAGNPPADELQQQLYTEKEETNMSFKEKLAAFFSELLSKMPDDGPAAPAKPTQPPAPAFSEADIERIKSEAAQKERAKVTAEFAETQRQTRLATLKSDIAAFCEGLAKQGKITPATIAFGLPEILFSLAEIDNQIEFGEAKEKATAFDRMKSLLDSATPLLSFSEVATRSKDAKGATGTAADKLSELTKAKMKDKPSLTYSAAFAEVQQENPDLAKEYMAEFQGE